MPNKNPKRRRRVVMTSDVVPVGARDGTTASDGAIGEEATSAVETPETVGARPSADVLAAAKEEGAMVNDTRDDDVTTPDVPAVSPASPEAAADESNPIDAATSDQLNGADEVTEPAAKSDELWVPE